MNNHIDYSLYNITSTKQFDDGLAKLRKEGCISEIKKLFRIIDEIIQGEDMYEKEYSRQLKETNKIQHIHLDGRKTGDIVLLYTINGKDIDLDLRLYNITDHKMMDKVANPRFTKRQHLDSFNVIENKYSPDQLSYVEDCYLSLISEPQFYKLSGERKNHFTEVYINNYLSITSNEVGLSEDEFHEILQYFESKYKKSIFGALDFSENYHTAPITSREEQYIMNIFLDHGVDIQDAYIETEVDEYGDTYETMYVSIGNDSFRTCKLLESELLTLDNLFKIFFDSEFNGIGHYGKIYEFSHYFE